MLNSVVGFTNLSDVDYVNLLNIFCEYKVVTCQSVIN